MTEQTRSGRSQAFFEDYRGRTAGQTMPVQPLDVAPALETLGIRSTPLSQLLARVAFRASGFAGFHRQLPSRLDDLVEGSYHVAATGPIVAATMGLADVPFPVDPFVRAAAMIEACWEISRELRDGTFAPDEHRGQPLEMRQYVNLFGTMSVFDGEGFRLFKTGEERRLLVLARGRFFLVDLPATSECSLPAIAKAFEAIWAASACPDTEREGGGFGWLSCVPLPEQASQFRTILEDPASARSYELLKSTFVTVCLDVERSPADVPDEARQAHSGNCGNRWFHSSLQLVVFGNAKASVICDFNAGLGGNTMMRGAAEIHRRSVQVLASRKPGQPEAAARTEPLCWKVDPANTRKNAAAVRPVLDTQQATFELQGRGRAAFAAKRLDPVPVFSVAVQLAVFRLTGRFVRVRQFVSQAKFRAHNVALASVSTSEMRALIQALAATNPDQDRVRELLRAAIDAQRQQNRNARSYVSVARALQMFRSVQVGRRAAYAEFVFGSMFKALRALKLYEPVPPTDVVLSHPDLFPEVPVMGRPGIRLPYVGCFGLHYLIWDDRITVTAMPSTKWTIPNAALVAEIASCLDEVMGLGAA